MFIKVLSDANVLLSVGFLCFVSSYAVERYVSGAGWDFVRGVLMGLSMGAFIVATVMIARQASQK